MYLRQPFLHYHSPYSSCFNLFPLTLFTSTLYILKRKPVMKKWILAQCSCLFSHFRTSHLVVLGEFDQATPSEDVQVLKIAKVRGGWPCLALNAPYCLGEGGSAPRVQAKLLPCRKFFPSPIRSLSTRFATECAHDCRLQICPFQHHLR